MFPRSNPSGGRAIAFLNGFELFEFFPARSAFPRFGPVCWADSIVSQQPCGNHLPASTGGTQVTGGLQAGGAGDLEEVSKREGAADKKRRRTKRGEWKY